MIGGVLVVLGVLALLLFALRGRAENFGRKPETGQHYNVKGLGRVQVTWVGKDTLTYSFNERHVERTSIRCFLRNASLTE